MRLQDRRILVTGANGFVGGRISRALAREGAEVVALVRRAGAADADGERVVEAVGELLDADDVRSALAGCDGVVHCAATAGDDLEEVRAVNRDGTRTVVDAGLDAGVERLVHISTGSVYDREGREVLDEDTPMVTDGDPYSVTKAEAEREVAEGRRRGLSATVLRPPAVLGWSPTSTWGEQFPTLVAEGRFPFTPHPDHTHAWVHVDDLAEAAVAALADDRADGRTYNVVGGNGTWRRYIDAVLAIVGDDAPDPFAGGQPREPWTGRYDASRIVGELGVRAERTFDEALEETARHWTPPSP